MEVARAEFGRPDAQVLNGCMEVESSRGGCFTDEHHGHHPQPDGVAGRAWHAMLSAAPLQNLGWVSVPLQGRAETQMKGSVVYQS